jgi:hypothetical protein
MTQTMTYELEDLRLQVKVCPTCGVTYALPERLIDERRNKGGNWYCPNGHSLVFTKTKLQELEEKLQREKENSDWWRKRQAEAEERARAERDRANGYKGQAAKLKKRVSKGVCPCCNRHFANVERHMSTQHPDFQEEK